MIEILHSLKSLHTFSLDASCNDIKTANSVDSLITCVDELSDNAYIVLGEGSNTVFVEDYPETVLINKIIGIEYFEQSDAHKLVVGAGENWHQLVTYCVQRSIGGFENLALIPGTVGAAPIQNIGAYGVEIERFIEKVEFYERSSRQIKYFTREECEFGYRESIFKRQAANERIITRVFFSLPKQYSFKISYGPLASLQNEQTLSAKKIFDKVIEVRRQKLPDPAVMGNAGSFFKNPVITHKHFVSLQGRYPDMPHYLLDDAQVKIPAAWLIDTLGFKGKRSGNIICHTKQPLVIANCGKGLGKDVIELARSIKSAVNDAFNIELENEVRLIGTQGAISI
jgi:UDP-N-acetylmuramate dehydrogenase